MPAKFEEDSLIWVAADTPLSDPTFLSNKIKDLCGDLPIFWLRPTYPNGNKFTDQQSFLLLKAVVNACLSDYIQYWPSHCNVNSVSAGLEADSSDLHVGCQLLSLYLPAGGQRKRRAAPRQRRQATGAEEEVDVEAEFNPENPYHVSPTHTHTTETALLP